MFLTLEDLPDMELLTEVKLSRVYHYFTGDIPAGIITAFRGERTIEQNVKLNKEMVSFFRSQGFGYTWIDGSWIENQGTPEERHVSEVSVLVSAEPGKDQKLFDALVKSAARYNQDAFVFRGTITDGKIGIFDKTGEQIMSFDDVRLDRVGEVYSKLRSGSHKNRTFVFEGERDPVGFPGKLIGLKD